MTVGPPQILRLLNRTWLSRSAAFTGLGVVFYLAPVSIPSVALQGDAGASDFEPVQGVERIAARLAAVADAQSPWHDGFHFVDAQDFKLTHLAQYVAPPIPAQDLPIGGDRPAGARHMTALLTSRIARVAATCVMSVSGEICIYATGHLITRTTAGNEEPEPDVL